MATLLLRLRARLRMLRTAWSLPVIAGADDGAGEPTAEAKEIAEEGKKSAEKAIERENGDPGKKKEPEEKPDDEKVTPDDDWKTKSRKNETRAKRAERDAEELRDKLKKREDADKSEEQKKIDAAREEGESKAKTEAEKERRSDRLEVAVTRAASKGVEVKVGDEEKTLRFDDPEDALVFIERQLSRGDLDEGDIFGEDGKVNTEAVTEALADLLKEKPKLAADAEGRKSGDPDTRKGGPADKDLESMSPEDHAKRKYPASK